MNGVLGPPRMCEIDCLWVMLSNVAALHTFILIASIEIKACSRLMFGIGKGKRPISRRSVG